MKSKKGFTLVELIAVIAILAVVITIASIGITAVKKNILKKERQNLQTEIKAAAQSYHDETGINIVPVNILLQIGTLQADTTTYTEDGYSVGDPVILDPVDGKPINCDAVIFDDENNASYIEDEGCTSDAIAENSLDLSIQVGSTSQRYTEYLNEHNGWISPLNTNTNNVEDVYFYSSLTSGYTSNEIKYIWTNVLNPDVSSKDAKYKVIIPENKYINATYHLVVELDDSNTAGGYNSGELSKDFVVKLDAVKPSIENVSVVEEEGWTNNKHITAKLIDNESGIKAYKVIYGENNTCETDTKFEWIEVNDSPNAYDINEEVTVNNDYYKVCVKDNAGYITSSDNIIVKHNDNTLPVITLTVDKTSYEKKHDVTVKVTDKGDDDNNISKFNTETLTFKYKWLKNNTETITECPSSYDDTWLNGTIEVEDNGTNSFSGTATISYGTGRGQIYVCPTNVKDKVGNTTDKLVTTEVKMDNTAPKCQNDKDGTKKADGTSTSWRTADSVTITQYCYDSHSKCVQDTYTNTYSNSIETDIITISDKAGNTKDCTVSIKLDNDAPTCGTATNANSTWTNQTITIKQACNDTGGSGCERTSYDTKYDSGATSTSQVTISDNAGNSTVCTYNVYVDKIAPTCGTATNENSTWTNQNITITQACNDADSGCELASYNTTYTTTTKTGSVTIKDHAQNTKSCTYDVYVDKTAPTASISVASGSTSYNTSTVKITVTGSDTDSGVVSYCYTTSNDSSKCTWTTSGTYSNVSTGKSYDDGGSITYYGFTKDNAGNISSVAQTTYSVYKYCTSSTISGYGSYGSCNTTCGNGYKYRDVYYKDTYFTDHSCQTATNGDYASCTVTCIDRPSSGIWCNIRGDAKISPGFTWTCTGGHDHTQGYRIYCIDEDGYIKPAKLWKLENGYSVASLVCPTNPYGTSNGWYIIDDSSGGDGFYKGYSPTIIGRAYE